MEGNASLPDGYAFLFKIPNQLKDFLFNKKDEDESAVD